MNTTATERPAPAGDRLYFHNTALQFGGGWAKSQQLGHYYPGDVAIASDGNILLAEVAQDTTASYRYLPQIIKVDAGGAVQASAFMTDSLGSAFGHYTTDMQIAAGAAGYVFCSNSSDQSSTPRVPTMYALSADLTTLLWAASGLGNSTDRIHDVRAASDGNSAFYCGKYYYSTRSTAVCYQVDYTGALLRTWILDQVSANKHCMFFNSGEDSSGNLYLFGLTNGGAVEGSIIAKFNTSNTLVWQKCLGGNPYSKSRGFVNSTGGLCHAQSDWLDGIMLSKVTSAGAVTSQTRLYKSAVTLALMSFIDDGTDGAYLLLRAIDVASYVVLLRVDSSFTILWQIKLEVAALGSFQSYPSSGLVVSGNYVYVSIPQEHLHLKVSKDGMEPTTLDAGGVRETVISVADLAAQAGSTTVTALSLYPDFITSLSLTAAPSGFAVRSSGFTPDTADLSGIPVTGAPRVSQVEGARFPGGFTVASTSIYKMDRSPGSSQVARSFSSIASATARQGVLFGVYVSDPLNNPQWIGDGDATLFIADAVSNTALDFTVGSPEVYVWRPSTYKRVGTLYNADGARMGTAATTANNEKVTAARFQPFPVYALAGDVIVVELWGQVLSTGQPSYTGTAYIDGATINDTDNASVTNYAANIRFSETLTFNVVSQIIEILYAESANATAEQDGTMTASVDRSEPATANTVPDGTRTMSGDATATATAGELPTVSAVFAPVHTAPASAAESVTGGASIDGEKNEAVSAITEQDISTGKFAVSDEPNPATDSINAAAIFASALTEAATSSAEQAGSAIWPVSNAGSTPANSMVDVSSAFGPVIAESAHVSDSHDAEYKKGGTTSEAATATASQNCVGTMGVSITGGDGDPRFDSVMLLMHMEGEDAKKETHDVNGHAVTFIAQAEMSTAQKKFGAASAYFPSLGGAMSIAKDGQFVFPGDFTFEGWAMLEIANINQGIAVLANGFQIKASGAFAGYFTVQYGASQTTHQTTKAPGTFYHWAVVRKNGEVVIYLGGVKSSMSAMSCTDTIEALPGGLILGSYGQYGEKPMEGWLDEVRISRYARYTDTFTPPSLPFPEYAYTGAMASELATIGEQITADQTDSATASETSSIAKIRYAVAILEGITATSSASADQITGDLIGNQIENCFASAIVTGSSAAIIDAEMTESATAGSLQRAGYTVQAIVQTSASDFSDAGIGTGVYATEQVFSLASGGAIVQIVVGHQASVLADDSRSASMDRQVAINETVKALSIIVGQILGDSGVDELHIHILQQAASLFVSSESSQIVVLSRDEQIFIKD